MRRRSPRADESGFTLIEVLVASTILVVSVLGTLSLMDQANATTATTRDRVQATSLARQLIEAARAVPYPEITPIGLKRVTAVQAGRSPDVLSTMNYRIVRNGTAYVVQLRMCVMDDPADGGGNQAAGNFCPGGAAPGSADRNAEDYKVVTASVVWTRKVRRSVVQKVIINDSGRTTAPAVTSLALRGHAVPPPPITTGTSLTVDFTTSAPATPVWRVDGVPRAPSATGDGRTFTATWSLAGTEDGVYSVSAHGLDGAGRSGAGRSLSVTLNRFVPRAPAGLTATRSGDAVLLDWQPSPERDVIGYTVYRRVPGLAPVAVCVREPEPGCTDRGADRQARYVVVASDLDAAGAQREGTPSAEVAAS